MSDKRIEKPSHSRLWSFRIVAVILSLLLVMGTLELVTRAVEIATGNTLQARKLRLNDCFETDPYLNYRLKKNFSGMCILDEFRYRTFTNDIHMRDSRLKEHGIAAGAAKWKVLALGDSFTFGIGVEFEDTFMAITERELRKTFVMNADVPGYNIYQYLEHVRHYALKLNPDLVLVNVFPPNDMDTGPHIVDVTADGYLFKAYRPERNTSRFVSVNKFAFNHSALFRFLHSRGIDFSSLWWVFHALGDKRSLPDKLHNTAKLMNLLDVRRNSRRESVNLLYQHFERVLSEINRSLAQKGVALAVNLLPFRVQVEPEALERLIGEERNAADFDSRMIHKRMGLILKRLGIPYFDSSERFEQEYRREQTPFFWKIDGHFTREGNDLMASLLVNFLRDHGLKN